MTHLTSHSTDQTSPKWLIPDEPLIAAASVAPHVLIDAEHTDAVEAVIVIDQDPLSLGQDCVVHSVPGDPEPFGDPSDGEVLDHDAFQRPPQPATRQLRPGLGRAAGVLAPLATATGATVATHRDLKGGRSPTQGLVCQPTDLAVARDALASAAAAPRVRIQDPAREHRPVGFESLAGDDEAKLVGRQKSVMSGRTKPAGGVASGTSGSFRWSV